MPLEAVAPIDELIRQARDERYEHSRAGRQVEAAASAIREKAPMDARAAMLGGPSGFVPSQASGRPSWQ